MPLVVTSYNEVEADDDESMMRSFGLGSGRWGPEINPFRSMVSKPSFYEGELLTDNGYWQAL